MTADVHTLAGAYAVDALPDEERAFFRRHLDACVPCRREVGELVATAARLGAAAAEPPPAHLRTRVLAAAAETRQLPPVTASRSDDLTARRRLRALVAVPATAAAVVAIVAVMLGTQLSNRVTDLEAQLAEAQGRAGAVEQLVAVLGDADATVATLESSSAARARLVSSAPDGPAVLLADGLGSPAPDRAYQLWVLRDGAVLPDRVFRPDTEGRAVVAFERGLTAGDAVAVSIEPGTGSLQPTGEIVLQGATEA